MTWDIDPETGLLRRTPEQQLAWEQYSVQKEIETAERYRLEAAARAGCSVCGHPGREHRPHPDGTGWPATVLRCPSCPDGRCILPEPESS
jgi:hypothetical protein